MKPATDRFWILYIRACLDLSLMKVCMGYGSLLRLQLWNLLEYPLESFTSQGVCSST